MSATTQLVRTAHATSIAAVGRELAAVHRDMLRAGGDDAAVRLSVLNLVIACAAESDTDDATAVIERIAARHPARVIMLVADPDAPAAIEADISLQCSAVGGREQVCAEVVRLRVGGESALHLVSVVTPLLLADVPVDLWLAGAARLDQALGDEALAACERLIVDTGAYSDPRSAIGM